MTGRGRIILGLFMLSLAGGIITGWDTYFSMSYVFGGIFVISLTWSRLFLNGLVFERTPRAARGQMGRPFWETLRIANTSRIAKFWIAVEDHSDMPGHEGSSILMALKAGQERHWLVRTLCVRRGRFHLGPTELSAADPFGLFQVRRTVHQAHSVVVLPMIEPLRNFPLPGGFLPGGVALQKSTHQITPNASGIREYAPGDSLNRIHWRTSARLDRLMAKEFELDPLTDVWIVLDGHEPSHFGAMELQNFDIRRLMPGVIKLPSETEEYCVAAAASIAFHVLEQDRPVGFIGYGESRHVIQSDRGEAQLIRIQESLAVLNAKGHHALHEVVKVEGGRISRGSTVLLITPSQDRGVLAAVGDLRRRGTYPMVIAVDAAGFGGPDGVDGLMSALSRESVPVLRLQNGQPIGAALSGPAVSRPHVIAA